MNRLLLAGALGVLLTLTACAQEVARDPTPTPTAPQPVPATPTPTATPEATPTPTPLRPDPTATPTAPQPLSLEVRGPEDGTTVRNAAVVVHGRTTPGATVTIGPVSTLADPDGTFAVEVRLEPGANRIEIVVSDGGGRTVSATRTVTFEVPASTAFFLLVTDPEDQSIVAAGRQPVSGRTAPDAIVSVNGVGVEVDEAGAFSTTVTLEQGPNLIEVVGTSPDGRVLAAVLAVIYRP
ncbi:MAG: hypothetical protein IIC95_03785 [Chloroflexi bacterium]|nr:hypothetical protein [Chloroflexota bacterium]MCH7655092.1 hypothetical protein [Chloroflexota bacterium]